MRRAASARADFDGFRKAHGLRRGAAYPRSALFQANLHHSHAVRQAHALTNFWPAFLSAAGARDVSIDPAP